MTDDNLQLSRRRVLAGAGAIGVASAGAGLGTTAYFSDHEEFTGNSLTAGELELFVKYQFAADQGDYNDLYKDGIAKGTYHDEEHDPAECSYELDDVKPGDNGSLEFCFSIVNNPAYLWACGMLTDEEAGRSGGHLADHLTATLRYCEKDDEGERTEDGDVIAEGSFRDVLLALRNGVPLDADGDGDVAIEDRACFDGSDDKKDFQDKCLCLDWEFPVRSTDPDAELDNNDAQAASMAFDLQFYAEQCRHNDGLTNPCVTSREVEGFGKQAYDPDATKRWFSKARNGGSNTFELQVGNTLDDSDTTHYDYSSSSFDGAFELAYDAASETAEFTVMNSETGTVSHGIDDSTGNVLSIVARGNDSDHRARVSNVRINGTIPTGADVVEADGDEIVSLNVEDVGTATSWTLTGDIEFEGLDNDPSASDENPAMYVDVLDA